MKTSRTSVLGGFVGTQKKFIRDRKICKLV